MEIGVSSVAGMNEIDPSDVDKRSRFHKSYTTLAYPIANTVTYSHSKRLEQGMMYT